MLSKIKMGPLTDIKFVWPTSDFNFGSNASTWNPKCRFWHYSKL